MEVLYALASLSLYFFSHSTIIFATKTNIIDSLSSPKSITINLIHSSLIVPKHGDSIRRMKNYGSPDEIVEDLLPTEDRVFFINVTLGNPPVPQLTIFDTGSKMIWVSCYPCITCLRHRPRYNRIRSSTFEPMRCDDVVCSQVSTYRCGQGLRCLFSAKYASETNATGFVGIEQMTFQEPDENVAGLVVGQSFGCAIDVNKGQIKDINFHGVFGLGFFTGSFLDRSNGKFTYCIESLDDKLRKAQVRFGNVDWEGNAALLEIEKANAGIYSVALIDITFGDDHSLGVKPHDAVLDTGTENMWLSKDYYLKLRKRVKTVVDKLGLQELQTSDLRLCYKGNVNSDLINKVPNMKLRFRFNVYFDLSPRSVFKQENPRYFCLAVSILQSDITGVTVIGLRAQQYYNMAYDLEELQLYFRKIDSCDEEDYI